MPYVLSPRDLVSRPDKMDETVPHTHISYIYLMIKLKLNIKVVTTRGQRFASCKIVKWKAQGVSQ